ncbi:MAG TPA: adenylosuccinate synthase [Nitrospiraceae bacterium]|nr:adenylosuccinate synthase [Nitrospiraceae bacterium]
MNLVIVGSQWGDEGKGKIVDVLARDADVVVRYQGGSNAGHTVVTNKGTYVFHLLPSGVLYRGKLCLVGNGVVVDPEALIEEIDSLQRSGVRIGGNLLISDRAHVIMPYHKVVEKASEESKGPHRIGTTGRGIGPTYADKMARIGVRMSDLLNPDLLRAKLEVNVAEINTFLERVYQINGVELEKVFLQYRAYGERLAQHIVDVSLQLDRAIAKKKTILFEGAQGTHLDVDFGTYPYVTSSSASAGGACTGTGVGPTMIDAVLGITKAYTTRVGSGPFPTELKDEVGARLQERGREFGATTGRPRRCGWFDAVAVRYAKRVNGLTSQAITKLDVLDDSAEINVCTAYRYRGKTYTEVPADLDILSQCEPVYETLPGWLSSTTGITSRSALPKLARRYLDRIEELTGCPIDLVSTGTKRRETIMIKHPLKTRSASGAGSPRRG